MKARTKIIIGIIISVICLAIFFTRGNIDLSLVWQSMQKVNLWWFIPASVAMLLSFYQRSLRWRIFLRGVQDIPAKKLFAPMMIGFMGNSIFPMRAGELIRPYILSKKENVSFFSALATIGVERIFDALGMVLFLALVMLFPPFPKEVISPETMAKISQVGKISLLGVILGISILFFITFRSAQFLRLYDFFSRFLPDKIRITLRHILEHLIQGLSVFKDIKQLCLCLVHTVIVWFWIALNEWLVLRSFGIESVSFIGAIFLMVIIAVFVAAPSAPGFIGLFQLGCKEALTQGFGIDGNLAAAVGIVLWVAQIGLIAVIGLICAFISGISLSEIKHQAVKTTETDS